MGSNLVTTEATHEEQVAVQIVVFQKFHLKNGELRRNTVIHKIYRMMSTPWYDFVWYKFTQELGS